MQLTELSPTQLVAHPGFAPSLAAMREEAELELFSGAASYDVALYQAAYERGAIKCVAVIRGDELVGWGLMTVAVTPRRANPVYATDAMWSADSLAGGAILRHFMRVASPEPLFISASVGGRLDAALSSNRRATRTHHVYTLKQPSRSSRAD